MLKIIIAVPLAIAAPRLIIRLRQRDTQLSVLSMSILARGTMAVRATLLT
jgi:hypothetical protein